MKKTNVKRMFAEQQNRYEIDLVRLRNDQHELKLAKAERILSDGPNATSLD